MHKPVETSAFETPTGSGFAMLMMLDAKERRDQADADLCNVSIPIDDAQARYRAAVAKFNTYWMQLIRLCGGDRSFAKQLFRAFRKLLDK